MSQRLVSQLPLLDKLSKVSSKERKKLLQKASLELFRSIDECIKNVIKGNVKFKKRCAEKLSKYKNVLNKINDSKHKITQKKKIIIQSGGAFLPALLSPILGVILDRILN